jgi:hypothetical protein
MPTTWSDTFTHDYFSDSTYTIQAGVEGTDFSVSANDLAILSTSTTGALQWTDQRISQNPPFTVNLGWTPGGYAYGIYVATISDSTFTYGLFASFSAQEPNNLQVFGYAPGGLNFFDSLTVTAPVDPTEITMTFDADSGVVTSTFGATSLPHTLAAGFWTALSAEDLYPGAILSDGNVPYGNTSAYNWSYDCGVPSNPIFTCNAETSSGPARIASYSWAFDDGTYGYGPIIEKSFVYGSGDHDITLTVTDQNGRRGSVTHTVTA